MFLLFLCLFFVSEGPDSWKANLKAPPKDRRIQTTVRNKYPSVIRRCVLLIHCCLHGSGNDQFKTTCEYVCFYAVFVFRTNRDVRTYSEIVYFAGQSCYTWFHAHRSRALFHLACVRKVFPLSRLISFRVQVASPRFN